ncbi:hypothetical protein DICVIV_11060 [Dictyocaulus viviparus]|uniref:Uncharacterized protein n=1 Tax=Dictyocaulus viviparus TaxID=29172 RepID=A0A0D8XGT5_DICVI|nr:hypothetical protein DICVIV_11060 [Dictyocaulus viviparus]
MDVKSVRIEVSGSESLYRGIVRQNRRHEKRSICSDLDQTINHQPHNIKRPCQLRAPIAAVLLSSNQDVKEKYNASGDFDDYDGGMFHVYRSC